MDPRYANWFHNGEEANSNENIEEVNLGDTYKLFRVAYEYEEDFSQRSEENTHEKFVEELEDAETPLFPSCTKYTKLSAMAGNSGGKSKLSRVDVWTKAHKKKSGIPIISEVGEALL
ncbi:hypothetical protein PanWU01x14_224200 [Parasponia andersonii]|uniref:Uncharacterized protein n=1 Tax=Parasponia andersonii TaxID=3476 RepID=A0A2P5BNL9_PARAD|nr:hypothetical protein PanWU01x14_224200 [Parasponia andersonii]